MFPDETFPLDFLDNDFSDLPCSPQLKEETSSDRSESSLDSGGAKQPARRKRLAKQKKKRPTGGSAAREEFCCEHCNVRFKGSRLTNTSYQKHLYNKHGLGDGLPKLEEDKARLGKKRIFKCKECGQLYVGSNGYKSHMRKVHNTVGNGLAINGLKINSVFCPTWFDRIAKYASYDIFMAVHFLLIIYSTLLNSVCLTGPRQDKPPQGGPVSLLWKAFHGGR